MDISRISKINAETLGKQTMLWQTMEECGELVKAIGKYNRTNGIGQKTEVSYEEARKNLINEIADVSICLEQLIYLFGIEDEVHESIDIALEKVRNRYSH